MEYGNGTTNMLVWKNNENRYHDDEFLVTADNPNINVAIMSNFVDKDARILDVGCGEGKFGALVRQKKGLLIGVDLDTVAGAYAESNNGYDKVYFFNIEDEKSIPSEFKKYEAEDEKFDVVALFDVLEHVINPTQVIYNVLKVLKPDGKILVSQPNVNNGDILLNLMRDHFHYRESGVLDNTHTKYFTKTSFVQWIQEMNELNTWSLDCEYVGSIYGYTDYMKEVEKELPLVYNFLQLNPYFHAIQHLFVLDYCKDGQETKKLDLLLQEKAVDLTIQLETLLMENNRKDVLHDIRLLPNERKIMEERYVCAQKGWEECSDSLKKANEYITRKENEIQDLLNMINKINNDSANLQEENANLQEENANLQEQNIRYVEEIENFKTENQKLQNDMYSVQSDARKLFEDNQQLVESINQLQNRGIRKLTNKFIQNK